MIWIILACIALVAVTVWLFLRRKKTSDIWNRVFKIKTKMNRGFTLWLEDGVSEPDTDAITAGLHATFEKARCKGYTQALSLSDYIIAIVHSAPSSDGTPCYKIPAGVYTGSEYDKGGYILVAGQMLTVGEPYGNIIVIPDHKGQFTEHLSLVAEFEAEHVVLAYNDGEEFERTKVHGNGQGHPIIPDCDGNLIEKQHILCGGAQ